MIPVTFLEKLSPQIRISNIQLVTLGYGFACLNNGHHMLPVI